MYRKVKICTSIKEKIIKLTFKFLIILKLINKKNQQTILKKTITFTIRNSPFDKSRNSILPDILKFYDE